MFGPELMSAFREFKSTWDPTHKLNPGKLVDAYLPTENLRLGAAYAPIKSHTHFRFAEDGGSFARATLRCIGIGECRKREGGTMCPSYMATLEEQHSTRGRAHLLFELLQGEVLPDLWKTEEVKRALDLCLSCKACKAECPTNVDIATYRAEFLAHYYEGRRRPLHAYAFGLVDRWLRIASTAPRLANALAHAPGLAAVAKRALHIAPARQIPSVAAVDFQTWARRRNLATAGGDVVLWVDTFNNAFHPETSRAAADVLSGAGLRVSIPPRRFCCGRPLYDFGFLGLAKQYLTRVLDGLRDPLERGTPIVVLEPSCASVFRDEARGLFPQDPRVERLRTQTFLLSEFLARRVPGYEPPRVARKILLHGHCHHAALAKLDDEAALLRKTGASVEALDAGCCGMAGAFGFEAEKHAVSQAIGERVLLPAVRRAEPDTVIVSDGFSCREQIYQATGRRAIHLAEVLQLA
jgi:Fe-S oxidoreductase